MGNAIKNSAAVVVLTLSSQTGKQKLLHQNYK